MRLRDAVETLATDSRSAYVYGQPYETVDGVTIITVSKVRGRIRPARGGADGVSDDEVAIRAKPVGVYVIRDGNIRWEPAVDATSIAILGEVIGLVAATLGTLAVVRRPPWAARSRPGAVSSSR